MHSSPSPAAGMASNDCPPLRSKQHPAWADLPVDLWCSVFLAAAGASMFDDRVPTPAATSPIFIAWVEWNRLLSSASRVCRALRDALAGPGSSILWQKLYFCSTLPGLSQPRSQQLNMLVVRRSQAATQLRRATILGGCWSASALHEVCASLPRQLDLIEFTELHATSEAEIIGAASATMCVSKMLITGSMLFSLPVSTRMLLFACSYQSKPARASRQPLAQALFRRVLSSGAPLALLNFRASGWALTSQDVQLLKQHLPYLEWLNLSLCSWSTREGPSQQAVGCLQLLSGVDLHLTFCATSSSCWQHLLQQLINFSIMRQNIHESWADLPPAAEAQLAELRSCERLVLRFKDPTRRLRAAPAGTIVMYDPI